MPTNRASMPRRAASRSNALYAYASYNNVVVPPAGALGAFNARFSSFANTFQTKLNASNGTGGGLGGTLEAQVDSALSQVMRQSGNGAATAVAVRPAETSIAALAGGAGGGQPSMSPYQAALLREARITQADFLSILDTLQPLSPFTDPGDAACLQALVRAEVTGLLEEFAYARLQPRQQRARVFLGGLLGYCYDASGASSPIGEHAPPGDIQALINLSNVGGPIFPTISVEDQLASQVALASDGALFDTQWNNFWSIALRNSPTRTPTPGNPAMPSWALWEWANNPPTVVPSGLGNLLSTPGPNQILFGPRSPQLPQQTLWRIEAYNGGTAVGTPPNVPTASYAEKMIQVDILLPVIAQDASRVETDLTAVGFTSGEQETYFAWFWSAVDSDLLSSTSVAVPTPPNWLVLADGSKYLPAGASSLPNPIPVWMTVADILDWARNLAGPTSADNLRQAGALGLNLICDQADELFWLVLAMLDPTASMQIPALNDTEVQLELYSLATDLNTLANLAY
jgi:hypothetical protein